MLRARGARIALDDAGNGYAGLQQIIRDRARHPQARPLARRRRPRRPAPLRAARGADLVRRRPRARRSAPRASRRSRTSRCSPALDVTYAQGWALARPDAPWAALAPQAAAAASAEVRIGMRVAREPHDDGAPTLGDLIARLTTVSCTEDIRRGRGDDPRGARRRRRRGLARRARRGLRRGHQPPRLVAARRALPPAPTTRRRSTCCARAPPARWSSGDPASDPVRGRAARAVGLPGGAHGAARVRRPRRRPARALPPPRAAVEQRRDRAGAAARAPARRGDRPARAHPPDAA